MPKDRVTVPDICAWHGIGRAVVERVLFQYRDRLPVADRVGIIRCWTPRILDDVGAILAEERRAAKTPRDLRSEAVESEGAR